MSGSKMVITFNILKRRYKILQISLIIIVFAMLSHFGAFRVDQVDATPFLGRYNHSLVYNPENHKIILFGGFNIDENSDLDDMWEYDCTNDIWKELHHSTKPPATSGHEMVYDSINRKFILFGGSSIYGWDDKTWIYDPLKDLWTEVFPQDSPSPRGSASMYFDPEIGETVLFGGYSDLAEGADETWTYNYANNTWTFLNITVKPPARYGAEIVYDPVNHRSILFGGRIIGQNTLNGTWEFNSVAQTWTQLNLTKCPSARYWYSMAYDSVNKIMVLFGGSEGGTPFSQETWIFNVSSDQWSLMNPESSPPIRATHKSVYDSESEKIVMVGGTISGYLSPYNDTWSYSYEDNTWIKLDYKVSEYSSASGFEISVVLITFIVILTLKRKK